LLRLGSSWLLINDWRSWRRWHLHVACLCRWKWSGHGRVGRYAGISAGVGSGVAIHRRRWRWHVVGGHVDRHWRARGLRYNLLGELSLHCKRETPIRTPI
jgi:hypothetical protein